MASGVGNNAYCRGFWPLKKRQFEFYFDRVSFSIVLRLYLTNFQLLIADWIIKGRKKVCG